MKRSILVTLLALGLGCEPMAIQPKPGLCIEFDHRTERAGTLTVCRMVFCGQQQGTGSYGGPATLWCEPAKPKSERAP